MKPVGVKNKNITKMATYKKPLSSMTKLGTDPIIVKPKEKLTEAQLRAFGTMGGTTDVKGKAAYLAKKGLIGASQLLSDHPDISTKSGIINAQSDWKTAATELMLVRARELGLKTPTQIAANRPALLGSLPPRLKDAINHPVFNQIHPNYWGVFDSVLKDQYDKENVPKPSIATSLAVK